MSKILTNNGVKPMRKILTVCAVLLTFLWAGTSEAALITSSGDAALSGATVDGFSSYSVAVADRNPASLLFTCSNVVSISNAEKSCTHTPLW